ncbi:MAG: DUF6265 family protein [Verrucomicrobiota bacterium]
MKRCAAWLSALVAVALVSYATTVGAAAETAVKATVNDLAWLVGTWSFERNGRVVTERWTAPAGGVMLGMSRTVAGEKTLEYESIAIRTDAQGTVIYVAKPSGQAEATFKLTKLDANAREVVFENPAHDFPQKISYVLKADGTLLAAIEGTRGGKARRVEFPYRAGELKLE